MLRETADGTILEILSLLFEPSSSIITAHQSAIESMRVTSRISILPRLSKSNLRPGPWLETVKSGATGEIDIEGQTHDLADLRAKLLVTSPGESFAYLTDFHSNAPELVEWLRNCDHVVCEAQYLHRDLALAIKNAHMTTQLVGELASGAGIAKLTLFHLSERYQPSEWIEMLDEVRGNVPEASFPGFLGDFVERKITCVTSQHRRYRHPLRALGDR